MTAPHRTTWAEAAVLIIGMLVNLVTLAGLALVAAVMVTVVAAGILVEVVVDACRPSRKVPRCR